MPRTKTDNPTNVVSVQAAVDRVIADDWYWFPVRHHSAATAMHLEAAILQRKPKLLLIEGPSEANDLIPVLANSKSKPPIAIYSCYQDDNNVLGVAGIASPSEDIAPRWACWYPYVEYSPELVAIRAAKKVSAEVRFIDLPHFARLKAYAERLKATPQSGEQPELDEETQPARSHSENIIANSNFYQALAEAGGYKSWDEGWDALFEFREFDHCEDFRREMLTFCAAARMSSPDSGQEHDETLDRERFMMRSIQNEIERTGVEPSEVMIVCGGFHTHLNRDDTAEPTSPPPGTIYTTVVPYTSFRIADISGYGAGNRAPLFYQRHWNALRGKQDNFRANYIVSVLKAARKLGDSLSAADAISISQHCRMLAALRGRTEPILDDLHDAIITCCCKGDPAEQGVRLQKAIDQIDIGNTIGKVPDEAPRLPIVDDFYKRIEQLGLEQFTAKEKLQKLKLDKREMDQFDRSAFLHRLAFCEISFCQLSERPNTKLESGFIFRESWSLKWSPEVEAKLIELNLLGDSIETAAVNTLRKRIVDDSGDAGAICRSLVAAMQMNLPNLIDQVFGLAMTAIEDDPRFISMTTAVAQLRILDRYAIHQELRREKIERMIDRAYSRSCFAMLDTASAPDEQHSAIIDGLTTLADLALDREADDPQRTLFTQSVADTYAATEIAFLRGALLGMLVETRIVDSQQIVDTIRGYSRSTQEQMVEAGDFIHGAILVSRTSIMTGGSELVAALDELIHACEWDVFMIVLPRLRAGMETLHARHRSSIATRVAEQYGLAETETLQKLDVSVGVALAIAKLDAQVAEIMSHWSFAE